jgi:hypothetical protein
MYATIGGLRWRFIACDSLAFADVEGAFGRFADAPAATAIRVALATKGRPVGGAGWSVEGDDDAVWLRRDDMECHFNLRASCASILYPGTVAALQAVVRIAASFFVARAGGFFIHAASRGSHGRALLVADPSAHETSAVLPDGDGYRCFATPFLGQPRQQATTDPLERALFPSLGSRTTLAPLRTVDALRRLLAYIFCFGAIAAHRRRLLDSAAAFVRVVPCFDRHSADLQALDA